MDIPLKENAEQTADKIRKHILCQGLYRTLISNGHLFLHSSSVVWGLSKDYYNNEKNTKTTTEEFNAFLEELQKIVSEDEFGIIQIARLKKSYDFSYEQIFVTPDEIFSVNKDSITELVKKLM